MYGKRNCSMPPTFFKSKGNSLVKFLGQRTKKELQFFSETACLDVILDGVDWCFDVVILSFKIILPFGLKMQIMVHRGLMLTFTGRAAMTWMCYLDLDLLVPMLTSCKFSNCLPLKYVFEMCEVSWNFKVPNMELARKRGKKKFHFFSSKRCIFAELAWTWNKILYLMHISI